MVENFRVCFPYTYYWHTKKKLPREVVYEVYKALVSGTDENL